MAAKSKSTFAKAQAALSRALKDFEKTVGDMLHSAPARKAKKAKKAKKKTAKKK